uniref:Uncharacterized protein n=1 Tax=Anopheles maculatus TaxID=74869 RepID=A0A182SR30_9DIPT
PDQVQQERGGVPYRGAFRTAFYDEIQFVKFDVVPKPTPDKSKKTWGQRLKLSKSSPTAEEKQNGSLSGPTSAGSAQVPFGTRGYDPSLDFTSNGPASLSNGTNGSTHSNVHQLATMKYAETWVYGTVRGMP